MSFKIASEIRDFCKKFDLAQAQIHCYDGHPDKLDMFIKELQNFFQCENTVPVDCQTFYAEGFVSDDILYWYFRYSGEHQMSIAIDNFYKILSNLITDAKTRAWALDIIAQKNCPPEHEALFTKFKTHDSVMSQDDSSHDFPQVSPKNALNESISSNVKKSPVVNSMHKPKLNAIMPIRPRHPFDVISVQILEIQPSHLYMQITNLISGYIQFLPIQDISQSAIINCISYLISIQGKPSYLFTSNAIFNHIEHFARKFDINVIVTSSFSLFDHKLTHSILKSIKSVHNLLMQDGYDILKSLEIIQLLHNTEMYEQLLHNSFFFNSTDALYHISQSVNGILKQIKATYTSYNHVQSTNEINSCVDKTEIQQANNASVMDNSLNNSNNSDFSSGYFSINNSLLSQTLQSNASQIITSEDNILQELSVIDSNELNCTFNNDQSFSKLDCSKIPTSTPQQVNKPWKVRNKKKRKHRIRK